MNDGDKVKQRTVGISELESEAGLPLLGYWRREVFCFARVVDARDD
jgi:hypothetical protein